jgi:molybdopterin-guanine dinucleotide biosynthesis protein A
MSNATIILAGGMSTRFGADKPFFPLHGQPLLSHAIARALRFSNEIVVTIGNGDSESKYARFVSNHVRVVKDAVRQQSPLVGILTGLRSVRSTCVMILPCDLPFVDERVASLLLEKVSNFDAAIPRWPNGNIEPLHSAYRVTEARIAAENALLRGKLRVANMIDRLNKVIYVDVDELRRLDSNLLTFFNINTKEDLWKAEEILKRGTG